MLTSRYSKCLAQCMRKDLHEAKPIHTSTPSLSDTEPEWFEPRNKKLTWATQRPRNKKNAAKPSRKKPSLEMIPNQPLINERKQILQKSEGKLFSTLFFF